MTEVWYKGVCIECGSDQPASYMERSGFQEPSCRYCGGVVNVIRDDADKEAFIQSQNERRGIVLDSKYGDEDDEG